MMLITAIILTILLSYIIGKIGKNRKFGFWGYFFCSILLTPLVGLLLVLASDPRPKAKMS
ncbi:MAG: hypothetical protein HQK71_02960 [Desulfamplus sp.]|nr:hypothetical protein [Desulfamplus sp.]